MNKAKKDKLKSKVQKLNFKSQLNGGLTEDKVDTFVNVKNNKRETVKIPTGKITEIVSSLQVPISQAIEIATTNTTSSKPQPDDRRGDGICMTVETTEDIEELDYDDDLSIDEEILPIQVEFQISSELNSPTLGPRCLQQKRVRADSPQPGPSGLQQQKNKPASPQPGMSGLQSCRSRTD